MKPHRIIHRSATRGFISAQIAIVLAILGGGASLLAYEWHHAHPAKSHHNSIAAHHHHKHDAKTATASN